MANRPRDLGPMDFIASHVIGSATSYLYNSDQSNKGQIDSAIEAFKKSSSGSTNLSGRDYVNNAYEQLHDLGELIRPDILSQAIKDAVRSAAVPGKIKSAQEMKMRYYLLFICAYLPENFTIEQSRDVILQMMTATVENYEDVINSCFTILNITKPDVYPDSDYLKVYEIGEGVTASGRIDHLRDFFNMLSCAEEDGGPQILLDMLPDGHNRGKFISSFAEFIKSGEYFKKYSNELVTMDRSYQGKIVLSNFMKKLGKDLGFTLEQLFIQFCSSIKDFKTHRECKSLVANYNDVDYANLVKALLNKPALFDEHGKNFGGFFPIGDTDFITDTKLMDIIGWVKTINYIVERYKELAQSIKTGVKEQALKAFIVYVETDEFRYKSLPNDNDIKYLVFTNPFACQELPLPDGFKENYCKPNQIPTKPITQNPPKSDIGNTKNGMFWPIALCILAGVIALSYCLFFRGTRMADVVGGDNAFRRSPISR